MQPRLGHCTSRDSAPSRPTANRSARGGWGCHVGAGRSSGWRRVLRGGPAAGEWAGPGRGRQTLAGLAAICLGPETGWAGSASGWFNAFGVVQGGVGVGTPEMKEAEMSRLFASATTKVLFFKSSLSPFLTSRAHSTKRGNWKVCYRFGSSWNRKRDSGIHLSLQLGVLRHWLQALQESSEDELIVGLLC